MKTIEYEIWLCKNPRVNDPEIDKDVKRAIVRASLNLKYRYDIDLEQIGFTGPVYRIRVTGPDNLIDTFSCMRLKGIALYLLRRSDNKEKYKNMQVGKRLISYLKSYSCNSVKTVD